MNGKVVIGGVIAVLLAGAGMAAPSLQARPVTSQENEKHMEVFAMADYQLKTGKIGEKFVNGYKAIEHGVVGGYKAIENGVVGGYKKIEGKFIDTFLEETGHTDGNQAVQDELESSKDMIGEKFVNGYKAIEHGVVDGYKAIESGVVGGYKKIEGKFIDTFLEETGHTDGNQAVRDELDSGKEISEKHNPAHQ